MSEEKEINLIAWELKLEAVEHLGLIYMCEINYTANVSRSYTPRSWAFIERLRRRVYPTGNEEVPWTTNPK